jgi:hypothetical protein
MLAVIEMPSGKLLRLPDHWQEYRKAASVQYPKGECQNEIVSGKKCIE